MNALKIIPLVETILSLITPELKTELSKALDGLAQKAALTKSPIDDIVIKLLRGILGI